MCDSTVRATFLLRNFNMAVLLLCSYVLAFESAREIKEHFSNLLPMETPEAQQFHQDFFKQWKPPSSSGTIVKKKYNSLDDFMKPKKDVSCVYQNHCI